MSATESSDHPGVTAGPPGIERRSLLRAFGAGSLSVATLGLLQACGVKEQNSSGATNRTVKLGYVTPQTGPLAAFGEADAFVIRALQPILAKGITVGGQTHSVQVLVKDSQSDPKRAADVANELIQQAQVDLMLVASTPDTTNPVSDQCEANGVPCIATIAPWQAWYFGRGATPDKPFTWTYHFFWGLDDIIGVYSDMWRQLGLESGKIGALAPNDSDGKAWADPSNGAFPLVEKLGYHIADGGRYEDLTNDFSAQISRFKRAGVPAMLGVSSLQGGYFAIGTWVMAEVCRLVTVQIPALGGGGGRSLLVFAGLTPGQRQANVYWVALLALVATIGGIFVLLRSRVGVALMGVRDDAISANSSGVRITRVARLVFLASAAGCGACGAILLCTTLRVQPQSAFSVSWTASMIFCVVIGGVGTIEGPILGALLFFVLQDQFAQEGSWYLIVIGLIAMGMALWARQGLWGLIHSATGVSLFPTQIRVIRTLRRPELSPPGDLSHAGQRTETTPDSTIQLTGEERA
jgi:ABC-type branched-subunit amino acid transport system substrate-binding protein